tara:strand:- start:128 stop:1402 length:1275 start_codon:yes stop_codon:yes gene_type:complete
MRVNDCVLDTKSIPFPPSTIENIDAAMMSYLLQTMAIFTSTNKGWSKVPVVWSSSERAFQSKRGQEIRDSQGTLVLPIITVERVSVVKDLARKGTIYGNPMPTNDEKGGVIPIAREINQEKTSNFTNADVRRLTAGKINFPAPVGDKVVYSTVFIPLPVYITATYAIKIRTEYQQQMNDIITPFVTRPGGVNYINLVNSGHRYEGFINEDFAQSNNVSDYSNEERKFETTITVDVLGYLIGDDKNQVKPNFVYRENAVEVKIPRERIILGEIPDHENGKFYGLSGIGADNQTYGESRVCSPFFSPFSNVPAAGTDRTSAQNVTILTSRGTGAGVDASEVMTIVKDNFVIREFLKTEAGALPDDKVTFTTANNIATNTETVFINGLLSTAGAAGDYTVTAANTIVFNDNEFLESNDVIYISYLLG